MSKEATVQTTATERKRGNWVAKLVLIVVAIAIAVVAYFILAAILPRWWADTIAGQIKRDLGASILVGVFYGFVFTFVPLLVAWQATNKRVSWPWKFVIVLIAVAIATPNLLTAGILIGSSESAHAGQRTLSIDAGFFSTWTTISAIAAAVIFVILLILWTAWRRNRRTVKRLKTEQRAQELNVRDSEKRRAEEAKEAERQQVIAQRNIASETERRRAAESERDSLRQPQSTVEDQGEVR
ncbi:hypothetical protein ACQQCD_11470 [Pseudarthrobacter sp. J1763]|uniref:hypothetical protein n=1 Tax=Pseudarthrobacter sp. J1763 TaxID=3420445 RepID=UPI003D2DBC4E